MTKKVVAKVTLIGPSMFSRDDLTGAKTKIEVRNLVSGKDEILIFNDFLENTAGFLSDFFKLLICDDRCYSQSRYR